MDPAGTIEPLDCYGWTPLLQGGEVDCEATRYTKDDAIAAHRMGWSSWTPIVGWLKYVGNHCYVVEMGA